MNIYVACPKNYATGGVELLHQVVYFLNTYNDINAYIYYVGSGIINKDNPHPADYIKYNNPYITNIEYKNPSDTIIVPEIYVNNLFDESLKLFRKVIYWESVDNYFGHIRSIYRMKFPENCIHMAQSYYALDFLENIAKADDIIYVTDYLNDSYFDKNTIIDKKKQVLYNPAKGLEFTKKIINKASDIEFIPIKDLNREQVYKGRNSAFARLVRSCKFLPETEEIIKQTIVATYLRYINFSIHKEQEDIFGFSENPEGFEELWKMFCEKLEDSLLKLKKSGGGIYSEQIKKAEDEIAFFHWVNK